MIGEGSRIKRSEFGRQNLNIDGLLIRLVGGLCYIASGLYLLTFLLPLGLFSMKIERLIVHAKQTSYFDETKHSR